MYLCHMDESGTPDIPGNTSHFILVGLSIPVWHWKKCDREIAQLKRKHFLGDEEIHFTDSSCNCHICTSHTQEIRENF